MTEVLSIFAQYGLPGLLLGAMFLWVLHREREHAREVTDLQTQLKDAHAAHKADLKDASKTLIAAHADIHEVVSKLGRYFETQVAEDPRHRPRLR